MTRRDRFLRLGGVVVVAWAGLAMAGMNRARAAFPEGAIHVVGREPSSFDAAFEPVSAIDAASPVPELVDECPPPEPVISGVRLPPSPNWRRYSYAEALIMGRDNQAFVRPLVVNATATPEEAVLTTQNLQYPYGGGVRSFFGQIGPDCQGWEVGYFGLYGLAGEATSPRSPDTYSFPNFFGQPVSLSDIATITGSTTINGVEANMFHHFERFKPNHGGWLEVDWLAGFRYIGVEDTAQILMLCCNDTDSYRYGLGTRNSMFGGQIGGRARLNYDRWAFEGWGKAGILGNAQKQYQQPVISTISGPIRGATSSTDTAAAMVADINLSVIYRISQVWGLRMGFNTIWLGGLALAADQFDFTETTGSGTILQGGGGMFLSGVNAGLEARW